MKKQYLDYAGLKRVLKRLLPGARKIWHGTQVNWEALSETERDKYDQAEIIDAIVDNVLHDIIPINSAAPIGKVLPSYTSGNTEEVGYFILPKKGTYMITWSITLNGDYGGANHAVIKQPFHQVNAYDNCTMAGFIIVNCLSDNYRFSIKASAGSGNATYTIQGSAINGTAVLVH